MTLAVTDKSAQRTNTVGHLEIKLTSKPHALLISIAIITASGTVHWIVMDGAVVITDSNMITEYEH